MEKEEEDTAEIVPEEKLLHGARNGRSSKVRELLVRRNLGIIEVDINCKGKNKANLGWSPLHLASYFGHKDVVSLLLENGADVNIINSVGDTPLHKAAFTGRLDVVMLLLGANAEVMTFNAEGETPRQVTQSQEIRSFIEAAEKSEERKAEESFLDAARNGDCSKITQLLKRKTPVNVNSTDIFGNTALHCAAYRGNTEVAVLLLQSGIDTTVKNSKGCLAQDLARQTQMKQLLGVKPFKQLQKTVLRFEGPLLKRSRLLGWKPVWLVVERGVLSIFKNRGDASTGCRRKTCKYLDDAKVQPKQDSTHIFVITFSDHTAYTFCVDPNSLASVNRQKWENALNEHIAYSNYYTQQGAAVSDEEELEELMQLGSMQETLQTAQAHQHVLEKQISDIGKSIEHLTSVKQSNGSSSSTSKRDGEVDMVKIQEQLSQVLETSRETSLALSNCLTVFKQQEELRNLQLQQQTEKSRVLEDALHILAEEHHDLERSVGHRSPSAMFESEEDEFFECSEGGKSLAMSKPGSSSNNNKVKERVAPPVSDSNGCGKKHGKDDAKSSWGGRTKLPVPMFSRNDFSVWSILKQCIGKELSKITMPVIFNEPLSFLQRTVEYMEYSDLIQKASDSADPLERLEYVTAFAVSATASNWERIGKPFNPLLGETYELSRDDLGFRIVCEQVSHHPPVSAFHVDSELYTFHGAVHPKLKFWGKSVEVTPKGLVTLHLKKHNESYSWQNVNCCVHNIIVGKIWVEHYGSMEVTNHTTRHKAVLNFKPSGWFGKDLHKVDGYIYDQKKRKVRAFYGKWIEAFYSYDVETWERCNHSAEVTSEEATPEAAKDLEVPDPIPVKGSTCNLQLSGQKLLWLATPKPEDSTAKYYSFTLFAMMLNELDETTKAKLAPTDSRLRPDIRKLEDGDIDGAGEEKNRLEEKQRASRKDRKKKKEDWPTRWFHLGANPHTGKEDWLFTGEYWKRNFDNCTDIF